MEENQEALKVAMEQYAKLSIPWKKEKLLKETKRDLAKKKKEREKAREQKEAQERLRQIEESQRKQQEAFNRLQEQQKLVAQKLQDPKLKDSVKKEELSEHAAALTVMCAEQKAITNGLEQSKQVLIDFLMADGREALVQFFKIKGGI